MEKRVLFKGAVTGADYYAIIERLVDGFILDSTDMVYKLPATVGIAPALALTELAIDAVPNQIYEFKDSTTVWDDGHYSIYLYEQLGALPVPTTDDLLATGLMLSRGDALINRSYTFGEGG